MLEVSLFPVHKNYVGITYILMNVIVYIHMSELRRLGTGYFTLRQIKAATDDFDLRNKIGEGGFGPVYKVELASIFDHCYLFVT